MVSILGDFSRSIRVPDDQVAIASFLNDTFLRIEVKNLGSVCRCYCNESIFVHDTRVHPLRPNHCHTVLDPIHAVRDLPEIVFPKCLSEE